MPISLQRARGRAGVLLVVLLAVLVGGGVWLRVLALQRTMLDTWQKVLIGGGITTQATVDEWYSERTADVEGFAASMAKHAMTLDGEPSNGRRFALLMDPLKRRGKFIGVWVVDEQGAIIAASRDDSLRVEELTAVRTAVATGKTRHSDVMPVGSHAAWFSIAAPVHLASPRVSGRRGPAAVVLRTDVIAAFAPWAAGRPNAAQSLFATSGAESTVMVYACPEQNPPVCIATESRLSPSTPAASALARIDSFGVFEAYDGARVLAATRFDSTLGWGIVRQVRHVDAVVPLHTEYAIEGAFLAVLLALVAVGTFAANRTIRVRRLHEHRQASEHLATVVEASTDGIISLDEHFTIRTVNSAVERLLGYPRGNLLGRPVLALFSPEWHAPLADSLSALALSKVPEGPLADTERCVARRADGRPVPVEARVGRAEGDGAAIYVMGLRDVSERARTELFLHGQRQVLELIASGAPVVQTMDVLLRVVEAEAPTMCCAVYQLEDDRFVARLIAAPNLPSGLSDGMEEAVVGPSSAAVGTAIHCAEAVFSPDIAADPLWDQSRTDLLSFGLRGAFAMPLKSADGHVIGALACYYEEARQATSREIELAHAAVHLASIALSSAHDAASLRASEASFRSFVENAPAAIYRETRRGGLVSTNPAMVALLGYPSVAELSRASEEGRLYNDPHSRRRLLRALEDHDIARGVELEWRRADGTLVAVRVSARAYRDDRGAVWLWEGYAEDVTPLRAAEQALRRNERLAAVGQLISGVAHELNNPLSSILHFAEDLLSDTRSKEDAEALGVIREQARRSRAIVRDLLSFVRQRATSAEPISLSEVVAATARGMRPQVETTGARLHLVENTGKTIVLADRAGVEQIVTNLVSNAVHAAGLGGDVWVRTERDVGGFHLIVEDSGPGVPEEILPRIFDPFFTTKPTGQGTGLGLSVTLGIVEQFGGRIGVDSRVAGRGSRFTVFLPSAEPEPMTASDANPTDPADQDTESLQGAPARASVQTVAVDDLAPAKRLALIIDDEPAIRSALRRYFTRRGWAVEEAADGRGGLDLLEAYGERIGVVISDLRMPGYSGIELHDRLAEAQPELLRRFVFSTGDVASAEAANFVRRTLCPVLQKPFELRMLDDLIANVGKGATAESTVS